MKLQEIPGEVYGKAVGEVTAKGTGKDTAVEAD
jgi:hypothetical protein